MARLTLVIVVTTLVSLPAATLGGPSTRTAGALSPKLVPATTVSVQHSGVMPTYRPTAVPSAGSRSAASEPDFQFTAARFAPAVTGPGAPSLTPADFCFGIWPARGGQELYKDDCYGHDEPGLSAYSSLPGSGGNVSWTFRLPVGHDATHNQSDLYGALWFGMVLTDSNSALGQAFLELQFYPDHKWTSATTVNGNWIGAARVVQADLFTGFLDDAYVSPLLIGGVSGQYLNMNGGDAVQVNLTGWTNNPLGEQVVVRDQTLGVEADHRLYNATGGYPLNPSYSTNSFPDALEWTNTGAPAVSFSFETGHAENPSFPENSSFRGCTPGVPPPTPTNPSVPCPSYDPSSWANDTDAPLRLSPPTFSNGSTRAAAAEIEIVNPVGGASAIDALSNGTCQGREGSAYCSYPWFSYSCAYRAFEFGATNYPETSTDFGKYSEYAPTPTQSAEQFQYYLPQRFALPPCGDGSYSLNITTAGSGGGTVRFLNDEVVGSANVSGLLPGNYSLDATPTPGKVFAGWTGSTGAVVADPTSPRTNVAIRANGSVTANFAATGSTVHVALGSSGCPGRISVIAGVLFNATRAPQTVRNGSVDLEAGIYSMQAMADPGCVFVRWSWDPAAAELSGSAGLFTWLVVTGAKPSFTVTATFAHTTVPTALFLFFRGYPGTVVLNGSSYTQDTRVNLPAGTYSVSSTPLPGNPAAWTSSGVAVNSLDLRSGGNVTVAPGILHSLTFHFNESARVRANGTVPGGRFSIGGGAPIDDGLTIGLEQAGPTEYPLLALPPYGEQLTGWTASPKTSLWPDPAGVSDTLLVNASGNLTARFAPALPASVSFGILPLRAGSVRLDLNSSSINGTTTLPVAPGTHLIEAIPDPGFSFAGWRIQGNASLLTGGSGAWPSGWDRLIVASGTSAVNATFVPATFPVTFVSNPPGAIANIGNTPVTNGATLELSSGSYALHGTLPSGGAVGGWTSSPGLSVVGSPGNRSVVVGGPGTLYASGAGPLDGFVTATPSGGEAPLPVRFSVLPLNGTPPYALSWEFGDGTAGSGSSPLHSFGSPGRYLVHVWINDSRFLSAVRTLAVPVTLPPIAVIMGANETTGAAPLWVAFNGSASGGLAPYRFEWDFGDEVGSASGNATRYEFQFAGNFTVTLTAVDSLDNRSNASLVVSVQPPSPLVVDIVASPENLTLGSPTHLGATVSGGYAPYEYLWGGLPTGCTDSGSPEIECTPAEAGSFRVSLQVTDAAMSSSSAFATIHVSPRAGGQGEAPAGLLGLPQPWGIALILGAVAVGTCLAAFLLLRPPRNRGRTTRGHLEARPRSARPPSSGGSRPTK